MALGETVVDIQKDECFTSRAILFQCRHIHPDFNNANAHAREDQMHNWADDGTKDVLRDEDDKPVLKADGNPKMYREHIDRARPMIDTRKWLTAKVLPTVFGVKWSCKFGQDFEMYPTPTKGYENDEATEFFRKI